MSNNVLGEIWDLTRNELDDDFVGLWELVIRVRNRVPELDDRQVQDAVLAIVEHGLRRHEAYAGLGAAVGGLESVWPDPVDQIIERIRREWDALGRNPNPGEIVWLDQPRLDRGAQAEVVANPSMTFTQPNGSRVFVQQVGDRYDVVMERERADHGSWKAISEATLSQLARNLGWIRD